MESVGLVNALGGIKSQKQFTESNSPLVKEADGLMIRTPAGGLDSTNYLDISLKQDFFVGDGLINIVSIVQLSKAITAIADNGGGTVKVTATGHAVVDGEYVVIDGTTSYDGTYQADYVDANNFNITATYVADETGTVERVTITTVSAHGLVTGDYARIADTPYDKSSNTSFNDHYYVAKLTTTTFNIAMIYTANISRKEQSPFGWKQPTVNKITKVTYGAELPIGEVLPFDVKMIVVVGVVTFVLYNVEGR